MILLDQYNDIKKQIFDYFGYVEDWKVIPMEDSREYFWYITDEKDGEVRFANSIEELNDEDSYDYHSNEIYTQRFLPKYVYRGEEFTMVSVDTHTDGNKFLRIFDNSKEQPNLGDQ